MTIINYEYPKRKKLKDFDVGDFGLCIDVDATKVVFVVLEKPSIDGAETHMVRVFGKDFNRYDPIQYWTHKENQPEEYYEIEIESMNVDIIS